MCGTIPISFDKTLVLIEEFVYLDFMYQTTIVLPLW